MNEKIDFSGLGIAPKILTILQNLGFQKPTPIQEKSLPAALEGKDLIGIAQTGTGKTLAFGIPMVQGMLPQKRRLVVVPTRELALQVAQTIQKIGRPLGLFSAVLIGGESMGRQMSDLRRNPQMIIGTPGRIIDHLERKTLRLDRVDMLVLDEADRMLDMGFAPQLKRILAVVPQDRQTLLFSATMPADIVNIARTYMEFPVRVEIDQQGTPAADVSQELFFVGRDDKPKLLESILKEYRGSILVFSRTKHGAAKITAKLRILGHRAAEIHSNRSLRQRREALDGFKNGRYRILVATDIAARGIDVKNIEVVLNYDLPDNPSDYVHRIGRTGRAGQKGHAISIATPDQKRDVQSIERLIRASLPVSKHPEIPEAAPSASSFPSRNRGRGGFGRRPMHRGKFGGGRYRR